MEIYHIIRDCIASGKNENAVIIKFLQFSIFLDPAKLEKNKPACNENEGIFGIELPPMNPDPDDEILVYDDTIIANYRTILGAINPKVKFSLMVYNFWG